MLVYLFRILSFTSVGRGRALWFAFLTVLPHVAQCLVWATSYAIGAHVHSAKVPGEEHVEQLGFYLTGHNISFE